MTEQGWYAVADLSVGIAFLLAGLLVWRRGTAPLPAALLALAGGTWFIGNLAGLPGSVGAVAAGATYVHRGPILQLVLTMPTGRPRSRTVLVAVIVGYAVALVPALARSEMVALLLSAGVVAVTSYQRRWSVDALPVGATVAALAGPAIARLVLPAAASGAALLWYDACLLVVAAALATRLLRSPGVDVADLVVGLSAAPSQSLRDALARAVGDPTLQVAYVTGDGYMDAHGAPVELDADDGRAVTPLSREGRAFGFISHDPAVLADPLLVEAVATAAALTSANARLQADVERQAAEVRASRRRIVTAGLEERRRLEAELRVGPGARLDRVAALLDKVPSAGTSDGALDVARDQVRYARSDLRDLARGLHPLALRKSGLGGAVADLGASAPLAVLVEVDVDADELPDEVAATAYYVCAEGLTNVARHAGARSASVRVHRVGGDVVVTVTDGGTGGADLRGSGLRGLADRVQSLGGELEVRSDAAGTELCARVPTNL